MRLFFLLIILALYTKAEEDIGLINSKQDSIEDRLTSLENSVKYLTQQKKDLSCLLNTISKVLVYPTTEIGLYKQILIEQIKNVSSAIKNDICNGNCLSSIGLTCDSTNTCMNLNSDNFKWSSCANMDSQILTTAEKMKLFELGGFSSTQSLKLLYRASRDGFVAQEFHSRCDDHPNTLTLVKSALGYVFGGFTTQLWNHCACYKADLYAFVFSLRRNVTGFDTATDARRFNILNTPTAIRADVGYGPIFGGGFDFHISSNSNTYDGGLSKFGHTYQLPPGLMYGTMEASSYLGGFTSKCGASGSFWCFTVSEIEVFQLVSIS